MEVSTRLNYSQHFNDTDYQDPIKNAQYVPRDVDNLLRFSLNKSKVDQRIRDSASLQILGYAMPFIQSEKDTLKNLLTVYKKFGKLSNLLREKTISVTYQNFRTSETDQRKSIDQLMEFTADFKAEPCEAVRHILDHPYEIHTESNYYLISNGCQNIVIDTSIEGFYERCRQFSQSSEPALRDLGNSFLSHQKKMILIDCLNKVCKVSLSETLSEINKISSDSYAESKFKLFQFSHKVFSPVGYKIESLLFKNINQENLQSFNLSHCDKQDFIEMIKQIDSVTFNISHNKSYLARQTQVWTSIPKAVKNNAELQKHLLRMWLSDPKAYTELQEHFIEELFAEPISEVHEPTLVPLSDYNYHPRVKRWLQPLSNNKIRQFRDKGKPTYQKQSAQALKIAHRRHRVPLALDALLQSSEYSFPTKTGRAMIVKMTYAGG